MMLRAVSGIWIQREILSRMDEALANGVETTALFSLLRLHKNDEIVALK